MNPSDRTLGAKAARVERAGFIGRSDDLARVDGVLAGEGGRNIVFVSGPGGIGKTTFVREVARRASERGRQTVWASGPELVADPASLGRIVAEAAAHASALVVIDVWDQAGAAATAVRDEVLASLPEQTVVVLAGRQPIEIGWWGAGWERLVLEVTLPPLDREESVRLLAAHGLDDPDRAGAIAAWAGGTPLALVLAATAGEAWAPDAKGPPRPLVARLSRRLLEGAIEPGRIGILVVAAVARVTTRDVLAAALPGIDADEAFDWLERCSFVEHLADGLTLHALVGQVVLAEAGERYVEVVRDVRRRLADHLSERAIRERTPVSPDVLHLLSDPEVRWGLGWDEHGTYRTDKARPEDRDVLQRLIAPMPGAAHWEWIERYLDESPAHVTVFRDRGGRVCGLLLATTPGSAIPMMDKDPVLGPWLAHARALDRTGNAVLWRHAIDLSRDGSAPVQPLIGAAGIARSGLANPRYMYLPIANTSPAARRFASAVGAVHMPELDFAVKGEVTECHLLDVGPGGIVGAHRAAIYADLGLPLPSEEPHLGGPEAVREGLRHYHDAARLASNPLAAGETVAARAESVRTVLRDAIDKAFDDSASDTQLREVLTAGYLERRGGHDATARSLHISRAVYFRRLRDATDRVAGCLGSLGSR